MGCGGGVRESRPRALGTIVHFFLLQSSLPPQGLLLSHGAVGGPSTEVRDYQVTDGMKTLFSSRPSTDTVGDQVLAYEGPSPPRGYEEYLTIPDCFSQNPQIRSPSFCLIGVAAEREGHHGVPIQKVFSRT